MADLPPEIITEILLRLPVKPLLRLRCICKRWRSLIDSNRFIFLHLNKSRESNIILRNQSRLYQLDSNTINTVKGLHQPLTVHHRNVIDILGSSNGLLCIKGSSDFQQRTYEIAFWNPTIRKHRFLPTEPLNRNDFCFKLYGFGYDSFSNDFKLLSISLFSDLFNGSRDSEVKLYTLRTDDWKNLPSLPYAIFRDKTNGVFVGGGLHWLASQKLGSVANGPTQFDLVVAFDLRFESYREVPLPVAVNGKSETNLTLLGECLCVIENRNGGFDVWVMKEYGIRDSWCKLFSVEQQQYEQHVGICLKPLGYSRDGDKVLLQMDRSGELSWRNLFDVDRSAAANLCWYNLVSRDIINVTISGMYSFDGIVCVGSLVNPSAYSNKSNKFGDKKKRDDFLSKGFKLKL